MICAGIGLTDLSKSGGGRGEDRPPPGSYSSGTNITRIAKVVSLPLMLGYDNEAGFTFSIRVLPHKRFVRFRDRENL